MSKTTINFGTIKGLEVDLPEGADCVPAKIVDAFAEAFVRHMTAGAIVSDDVLISSIGASNMKEAIIGGARNHFTPDGADRVEECVNNYWDQAVLMARHGSKEGTRLSLIRHGSTEADAEKMVSLLG